MSRILKLLLIFALAGIGSCEIGPTWVRDEINVGSNVNGRIKTVEVVYDQCFSGTAKRIETTVRGESRWPDTFAASILNITEWGFQARVNRTDVTRRDWWQTGVNMQWKAYFDTQNFQQNPCFNEARCTNEANRRVCHCSEQYTGKLCDRPLVHCYPNPCNGGTCTEYDNGYDCSCTTGTAGKNCTKGIEEGVERLQFDDSINSMTFNVLYSSCKSEDAIDVHLSINNNVSAMVGVKKIKVYRWGLLAKVWRLFERAHPSYLPIEIGWRALFDSIDTTTNPCQNGGSCSNVEQGIECACPALTTGKFCEKRLTHCASSPCMNGGTCIPTPTYFTCECPIRYHGDQCELEPTVSAVVQVSSFTPSGPPYGPTIEVVYDRCYSGIATSVNGTVTGEARYSDTFDYNIMGIYPWGFRVLVQRLDRPYAGWGQSGVMFSYTAMFETSAFLESYCENGQSCTNGAEDGRTCNCEDGYTGELCETALVHCYPHPCNSGTCTELDNGYNCTCPEGMSGQNCNISSLVTGVKTVGANPDIAPYTKTLEVAYDECHGGVAYDVRATVVGERQFSDTFNATILEILPWGFRTLVRRTDRSDRGWGQRGAELRWTAYFEPGKVNQSPCLNGAICRNGVEGRLCGCPPDYGGEFCETHLVHCNPNPCSIGRCIELANDYKCSCPKGWEGKNCTIRGAWFGNTTYVGYLIRRYPPYYKQIDVVYHQCYSGVASEVIATATGSVEHPDTFEVSIANISSWGFVAHVYRTDQGGGWLQRSVQMEWKAFYDSHDYVTNPCLNGGTCTNRQGGRVCDCLPQYGGDLCERKLVYCYPDPCNGGICTEMESDHNCTCPTGATGRNCDLGYEESSISIPFGGLINSLTATLLYTTCQSKPAVEIIPSFDHRFSADVELRVLNIYQWGFQVKIWREVGEDSPELVSAMIRWRAVFPSTNHTENPCQNGGTCSNIETGTTCDCPTMTTGQLCETRLTHCHSSPCMNGGTCIPTSSYFRCDCPEPYSGDRCDVEPAIRSTKVLPSLSISGPPYGKIVQVVYDRCYSGVAKVINATVAGSTSYPDRFNYTILGIYPWGFRALVQRTDRPYAGWGQRSVVFSYSAIFESRAYSTSPCVNAESCTNTVDYGRVCNCLSGFAGEFCEKALVYCYPSPCNMGDCNEFEDGYNCTCPDGTAGNNCEILTKVSGNKRVGSQRDRAPYTKAVNVWYEECHGGKATEINATVRGSTRYSDTFEADITNIYTYGFRAVVRRTDRSNSGWGQENVRLRWTAYFDLEKARDPVCANGASCTNTRRGRVCNCPPGFSGSKCEIQD